MQAHCRKQKMTDTFSVCACSFLQDAGVNREHHGPGDFGCIKIFLLISHMGAANIGFSQGVTK